MHIRTSVITTCVSAVLLSGTAIAQVPSFDVTGPYIGLNLGGATGTSRKDFVGQDATTGNFGVSGVVGGGTAGFNWQMNNLVFGIEGDISGSGVDGSATGAQVVSANPNFTFESQNHWLGTFRPRLGVLVAPGLFPYVTGGLAFGDIETSSFSNRGVPGGVDFTRIEPGWTAGAGVEMQLPIANWSMKAEYLHVDLSDADGFSDVGTPTREIFHEELFRLGLNYRF